MSLSENFHLEKSASIAFDWSNSNGLSPSPYTWTPKLILRFGEPLYKQKERTDGSEPKVLSFLLVQSDILC